ncbi:hypothetical protein [Govanella unica]|uniref:Uncharacterized protein n=1 Tax=Govanella unica TaxID=2975056 RepID=A0A9X3Z663_9PROT|nr:hypothetical protein [Govania unica]MDA5192752.1 hypothetical protein [Govania unica]
MMPIFQASITPFRTPSSQSLSQTMPEPVMPRDSLTSLGKVRSDIMDTSEKSPREDSKNDPLFLIVPFQSPTDPDAIEKAALNDPDDLVLSTAVHDNATFALHPVSDIPSDTLSQIQDATEAEPNEALSAAAQCGALWKSIGIETAIYTCSYGATTLASGLIIRYTQASPLLILLLAGGSGVIANDNMRILFTSLLKPPGEDIPESKREQHANISKYALLPLSLLASGTVSGSTLSVLGDTNLGTQQIVLSIATQFTGPVMGALGVGLRQCYRGSVILKPEHDGVATSFKKFYSCQPNPFDEKRPYVFGTIRNMLTRVFAVTATVSSAWYSGGYLLENYCGPEGRDQLYNLTNTTGNYSGADVRDNCVGGNATFLFRDWGLSLAYGLGLIVVQPAMNFVCNKVFDYFYASDDASDEDDVQIEDVTDQDPETPDGATI